MKIAGLTMNDVWAHRVLREKGVVTSQVEDAPSEIAVEVDALDLLHHGPKQGYRPYLHLSGELRAVRCAERLPHGISEISFPPGGGERVEAYYEFTNQQLTELVAKGYFTEAFQVPEEVTGIEWELPAKVDAIVLSPDEEGQIPVVFTGVRDIASLSIDAESSGYDLAEYFADYSYDDVIRHQEQVHEGSFRTRTGQVESLFDEDELTLDGDELEAASDLSADSGTAVGMDKALAAAEADIDAEAQALVAEREALEGTPEHLYRSRVADAWEAGDEEEQDSVEDDEPETTAEVESLDLDLEDDEEEIDVAPMRLGPVGESNLNSDDEKAKHQLAQRVADFESDGDEPERGLGE